MNFIDVLKSLEDLIKETPPFEQPQRFGNKAYQSWYTKVENNYDTYIRKIVDIQKHPNLDLEIKSYFLDCFGSSKRIDYGTGHELNFLCILLILFKTGYFSEEDFPGVVHHLFYPYIFLVRNLQITYKLEPAGAHGVWGLDEYHFLPFLFGASELIKHPVIISSDIHNTNIMKEFSEKYMYLNMIKYVKTVKIGNFSEHSPMLDTISQVFNWEKVARGLVKMYLDEVLKKYVVMQHFYFGSVLTW